ncbi:hypothetical protein AB0A74_26520 [Saccharothrix sp. NPDC042600]|uniref:hypothetical protein n=1 Tax=Saccharothrix TaxID=2071 RepID=UPI0033DDFA23|nr:hypothetical protein GCM10017745_46400 [Saccharothrix mutabilis subsp. capreolus]
MRATTFVVFMRFIGAAGIGSFLGAAAAGLVAVATGRVFAPASSWVAALPVLALLGALLTAGVARLTRLWLVPQLTRRRLLWGAVAGAILTPLAIAVGQLGDLLPVALVMPIGSVVTAVLWVRWFRQRHRVSDTPAHALRTE